MKEPRTSVYLYADQREFLKQLSTTNHKSLSAVMREALSEWMQKHSNPEDAVYQEWKERARADKKYK